MFTLPFVFAAAGYWANGTTGMAAGWLIGSWLFGPKSSSTNTGINPQTIPPLNQALRGSPMFVTFGTNRLSAQITWTKNWKAIRHKSSGKGGAKGGGSQGMGSMKGGSGGYYYTYTWDLIYHYGIVDQPSMIRRAWIGGDPVDDDTLTNLTGGQNTTVLGYFPDPSARSEDKSASLSFTEGFFAPGYPTGSADLTTWPYFQQQEGVNCAWPYTCWVGFGTLDLGTSPAIPQLSIEVVPIPTSDPLVASDIPIPVGHTTAQTTPEFTSHIELSDVTDNVWDEPPTNHGMMIDNVNGDKYAYIPGNLTDGAQLVNIRTGALLNVNRAQMQTDITSWLSGAGSPAGSTYTGSIAIACGPCPGTPYFLLWTMASSGPTTRHVAGILYRLDNGVASAIGGFYTGTDGLSFLPSDGYGVSYADGTLLVVGRYTAEFISDRNMAIGSFPIEAMVNNVVTPSHFELWWTILFNDFDTFFISAPMSFVAAPVSSYEAVAYIPKAAVAYMAAHPGQHDQWDAIVSFGKSPCVVALAIGGVVDITDQFFFPDAGQTLDGTASVSDQYDDYTSVTSYFICSSANLVFARSYKSYADRGAQGTFSRVRLYAYNAVERTAIATGDISLQLFNITDTGHFTTDYPKWVQFFYDPINVSFDYAWFAPSGTTTRQGYVFGPSMIADYILSETLASATSQEVTPPYIIYKILTNTVYGFSVNPNDIDYNSYNVAINHCSGEGIYVSATYTTSDNMLNVIDELCGLYGGFLYENAGKIFFGAVKPCDKPIRIIDNSHLLIDYAESGEAKPPVSITKGARQDGYNKIKFNFIDSSKEYKNNQIEVSDEVDIDINGPRVKEYQPRYVLTGSVASKIAVRALWSNLYGRDIFNFRLGWKDADLTPGTLITLVDSYNAELSAGVDARIVKWSERKRGEFTVQAVQHHAYQIAALNSYIDTASVSNPNAYIQAVKPPLAFRAYELPKEFQGSGAAVFVGYNQGSAVMGAQLYVSPDGANFVQTDDVQPYIISGMFADPLPARPNGYVERGVKLYLMPTSGFNVSTPTWAQEHDLDDVSQALRANGNGVIYSGSEAMSIQGVTLLAQNTYRIDKLYRGWGGTGIGYHNSGDYWHYHSSGIFTIPINEDKIGNTFAYKVVPYNFAGHGYDIASIAANTYTIKGSYWLPREQAPVSYYVDSAVAWPNSTPFKGKSLAVVAGGCDVVLEWPPSSNAEGFGALGYGANGYGHFTADVHTPSYRIDVRSNNGTKATSFFVNTGHFRYNAAQNSADFNGFAQDLWFEVTPYNSYGDAPAPDVRTMTLFY